MPDPVTILPDTAALKRANDAAQRENAEARTKALVGLGVAHALLDQARSELEGVNLDGCSEGRVEADRANVMLVMDAAWELLAALIYRADR